MTIKLHFTTGILELNTPLVYNNSYHKQNYTFGGGKPDKFTVYTKEMFRLEDFIKIEYNFKLTNNVSNLELIQDNISIGNHLNGEENFKIDLTTGKTENNLNIFTIKDTITNIVFNIRYVSDFEVEVKKLDILKSRLKSILYDMPNHIILKDRDINKSDFMDDLFKYYKKLF